MVTGDEDGSRVAGKLGGEETLEAGKLGSGQGSPSDSLRKVMRPGIGHLANSHDHTPVRAAVRAESPPLKVSRPTVTSIGVE